MNKQIVKINPRTAGVITLTPLTKSGKRKTALASQGLVMDYQKHSDGSVTATEVRRYFVDRGITDAYAGRTTRYTCRNPRMLVEFVSVADAPHLAKQFGRLYDTLEMAVSDCE